MNVKKKKKENRLTAQFVSAFLAAAASFTAWSYAHLVARSLRNRPESTLKGLGFRVWRPRASGPRRNS